MGNRKTRRDTWLRRVSSRIANGVRGRMLRDGTPDTGCGIKVMHRETFLSLPRFDHMHRFLPALFQREGTQVSRSRCAIARDSWAIEVRLAQQPLGRHRGSLRCAMADPPCARATPNIAREMNMSLERVLRPGRTGSHETRLDLLWLVAFALLLIGTGIGLRDPWPADEPRFVLVARDMVASGRLAHPARRRRPLSRTSRRSTSGCSPLALKIVPFAKIAFLLPSLLAAIGCVVLVYDLARRLWNRETRRGSRRCALLMTVQFVWQARQAQIDATLCFWTTLGSTDCCVICCSAPHGAGMRSAGPHAGLGIITKGVGFLPLLVLFRMRWCAAVNGNRGPDALGLALGPWPARVDRGSVDLARADADRFRE